MVDIRTIRAKDKRAALAKATVEFGSNFTMLTSKDVKVGGIFGIGAKTEHELRIMLNDSMYDKRREKEDLEHENLAVNNEEKTHQDRRELSKHTATIDGAEMAERVVVLTKALKEAARERAALAMKPHTANTETQVQTLPPQVSMDISNVSQATTVREHSKDIDKHVAELVENKVKDIMKEYLDQRMLHMTPKSPDADLHKNRISAYIPVPSPSVEHNNKDTGFSELSKHVPHDIDNRTDLQAESLIKEQIEQVETPHIAFEASNVNIGNTDARVSLDADSIEASLQYLRRREFPEDVLDDMRDYLMTSSDARFFQSDSVIRSEVERYFMEKLTLSDGIDVSAKKKIVVLVGPTGVGKTTTIPKLAAMHIKTGKQVSFVTIDNYRIAAVDQLQRYASIMKVPFTTATTPDALRVEIRKMEQNSLLFVDTMGRSPKGAEDIVAMSKYFATVGRFDIDIQLVMSATVKYYDALSILNGFKVTGYKGIVLTKLDETDYLASALCAISRVKTPITYTTFGQGVPKDIATAKSYMKNVIEGLYGVSSVSDKK